MTKSYRMPICWLGKSITVIGEDGKMEGKPVTADMVNLDCHCVNEMQAFFCSEGHMTECHVGMSCRDAECSHLEQYDDTPWEDD